MRGNAAERCSPRIVRRRAESAMPDSLLSTDSAVKRHVLSNDSGPLPSGSMTESIPGEDSTLGERLLFAIHRERHRGATAAENALMLKFPEMFRSRGFLSSYTTGRRGLKGNPDPKAMKVIADFLHVNFEWLMLGSGPIRRGGRGETPAEEAMFTARDWGIRGDAWEVAWIRNRDRDAEMSAGEWFEAIRLEGDRLERAGVPRPTAIIATKDAQASVRRTKVKKIKVEARAEAQRKESDNAKRETDALRVVGGDK